MNNTYDNYCTCEGMSHRDIVSLLFHKVWVGHPLLLGKKGKRLLGQGGKGKDKEDLLNTTI